MAGRHRRSRGRGQHRLPARHRCARFGRPGVQPIRLGGGRLRHSRHGAGCRRQGRQVLGELERSRRPQTRFRRRWHQAPGSASAELVHRHRSLGGLARLKVLSWDGYIGGRSCDLGYRCLGSAEVSGDDTRPGQRLPHRDRSRSQITLGGRDRRRRPESPAACQRHARHLRDPNVCPCHGHRLDRAGSWKRPPHEGRCRPDG
jgi:hypothetical protein